MPYDNYLGSEGDEGEEDDEGSDDEDDDDLENAGETVRLSSVWGQFIVQCFI